VRHVDEGDLFAAGKNEVFGGEQVDHDVDAWTCPSVLTCIVKERSEVSLNTICN